MTAVLGLSQVCLQVQSLHYSFQIDLSVSLQKIQGVYYSSAGLLTLLSLQ